MSLFSVSCLFHTSSHKGILAVWTPGGSLARRLDHATSYVDIAAIRFGRNGKYLRQRRGWTCDKKSCDASNLFFRVFSTQLVRKNDELRELIDGNARVFMYGYPHSLFDSYNMLPVVRTGLTADLVYLDRSMDIGIPLNGNKRLQGPQPLHILDMACFGGSSGSPVVIVNPGDPWRYPNGTVSYGQRFFILLGIAWGTVTRPFNHALDIATAAQTYEQDLHVTLYWKATEIEKLFDSR